jgi:hypothetical protein
MGTGKTLLGVWAAFHGFPTLIFSCSRNKGKYAIPQRVRRSQDLPDAYGLLASRPVFKYANRDDSPQMCCCFIYENSFLQICFREACYMCLFWMRNKQLKHEVHLDDGRSKPLWNVGRSLADHTAQYPRRQLTSKSILVPSQSCHPVNKYDLIKRVFSYYD